MKRVLDRFATGRNVLIFFALSTLVYVFMLTVTIPQVAEYTNGMDILDMRPLGYDLSYVNTLFETLGEDGREVYAGRQIPADMLYPGLFAICYALVIAFFLKKLRQFDSWLFILSLLPILAGLFDYLENFGILIMLNSFPDITPGMASLTSLFSVTKSMTTTLFFIIIIVLLFSMGIQAVRKSKA